MTKDPWLGVSLGLEKPNKRCVGLPQSRLFPECLAGEWGDAKFLMLCSVVALPFGNKQDNMCNPKTMHHNKG